MKNSTLIFLFSLLLGCGSPNNPDLQNDSGTGNVSDAEHVVIIVNKLSPESIEIANYYQKRRAIPNFNRIEISCPPADDIRRTDYENHIESPIRDGLALIRNPIDYIVTTKGVPLRIGDDQGASVDARLAAMDSGALPLRKLDPDSIQASANPYYQKNEHFSHEKFGLYLVTRLDGYSVKDAEALVDRSLAARPDHGLFFFDQAENRNVPGYKDLNDDLQIAADALVVQGFQAKLDASPEFVAPSEPLMGYASWGSNDSKFDSRIYHALRFKPGALAETFVSTSGRQFRPAQGGQSLIADLISQGVTGVKGYVSEPYSFALARPHILFDRYVHGFNLAESFYMASPIANWKDVIIGDPLCRAFPVSK